MTRNEKTRIAVYLYATIAVLLAALALRGTREPFQTIPNVPLVKCVGSDGKSQCRFIDIDGSTKDTLVIRENTTSIPKYDACPLTSDNKPTTFNASKWQCDIPTDSADKNNTPPKIEISKVTCPKAEETFFPSIKACSVIAGTLPRCIPDNATKDTDEVKTAMPCYLKRYSKPNTDDTSVSKFGNDISLLWDDWNNLGVYNLRNPCCDPTVAPVPAGSIRIGDTVIEKDWKFWTGVGLSVTVVILLIALAVS